MPASIAKRLLVRGACTLLGCGITIGLYAVCVLGILDPIQKSSGRCAESLLGVALLIMAPATLIISSFAAGAIPKPVPRLSVLGAFAFAPGLWLCLIMWLVQVQQGSSQDVMGPEAIWIAVSWLSVWGGARIRARLHRPREGVCPTCDYDLTGNVSGRCPECGKPVKTTQGLSR
jgi:hypothetical protein